MAFLPEILSPGLADMAVMKNISIVSPVDDMGRPVRIQSITVGRVHKIAKRALDGLRYISDLFCFSQGLYINPIFFNFS